MVIYKITNIINGKIYIGKTTRSLKDRWNRHIYDALSNRLDTHFSRAIRKYGPENFQTQIIDSAKSDEELSKKEKYWINYFNSCKNGYNETIGGDGGNTYMSKTTEEMDKIKQKIRSTKIGKDNPMARPIKLLSMKTGEELHFGSAAQVRDYFGESNHNFVTRRVKRQIKYLFKGEWNIAYEEDEYPTDVRFDKSIRKSCHILVQDLYTGEVGEFVSYASAERHFGVRNKKFSGKAYKHTCKEFVVESRYKITILD